MSLFQLTPPVSWQSLSHPHIIQHCGANVGGIPILAVPALPALPAPRVPGVPYQRVELAAGVAYQVNHLKKK